MPGREAMRTAVRHGLYPVLVTITAGYLAFELGAPDGEMGRYYGAYLGLLATALIGLEALVPMRPEWGMTRSTLLKRDIPYLLIGVTTLGAAGFAASWALAAGGVARGTSHAAMPLVPAVILAIAIPEFLWYWVHRLSHEARGGLGRWLWRVHLPHHMPRQLYVMMHVVAHPLNTVAVRLILTAPLFLLEFPADAVFVASVIVGQQGLVSHFNVDMRAGWFNYLLVGNELHRYHHSAGIAEARNFGNVTPLWDLVFGTFVYRPSAAPRALGLAEPSAYPDEGQILRVLGLPFTR